MISDDIAHAYVKKPDTNTDVKPKNPSMFFNPLKLNPRLETLEFENNMFKKAFKIIFEILDKATDWNHAKELFKKWAWDDSNSYGKRRRRRKRSFGKKGPSVSLKKLCKKHKIRLSVKRGSKRVPKSEKVLKKQLANKLKKKKTVKRRRKRRSGYGSSLGMGPYPGSLMMRTPYFEMMKKA